MFDFLFDQITEKGNFYIIRKFPFSHFKSRLKRFYGTSKIVNIFSESSGSYFSSNHSVMIHKFFIPELLYLLEKFHFPQALIDIIIDNTWVKDAMRGIEVENRVDLNLIYKEMNVTLKDYQAGFISNYDLNKQKYYLNGCILSFEQGLGKTVTSLALMTSLKKKKVVIIAPKSTLESVWLQHIEQFFKTPKTVFVVNKDDLHKDYDFFLFNYESMDKLSAEMTSYFAGIHEDVGVIVDESHNFLRKSSNRTQNLIQLRADLHCSDMLLMSGTPLKALGVDIIPMLFVLDKFFDNDAMEVYKSALGVNTTAATDIIKARLQIMMHRKLKAEVLKLPDKYEENILVKIPDADKYCIPAVKEAVKLFIIERKRYHLEHMHEYINDFSDAMDYLKNRSPLVNTPDFIQYLSNITLFRQISVDLRDPKMAEKVKWTNEYEKNVIVPILPKEVKVKFTSSKSAIKYLHLKIRGEVIGSLLTKLRIQMTSAMMRHCDLKNIIEETEKKTILFTSYVDTIETADQWAKDNGYTPLVISGATAKDVRSIIDSFNKDPKYNPLIASIMMVATGVTLTAANSSVFTNKPFRYSEYIQACDRTHRIGQDTDCFFYTLILDTGKEQNLSTRMEDIMVWSKTMFDGMVGLQNNK